ncbi:hypothetical protein BH23ACT9_BH23ACT9_08030 [soil metagenome]
MKAAKPDVLPGPLAEPEPPPMTIAQVTAIADVLARHGVEYILIGGMGGQIQGVPVGVTRDADFTARQTGQNLERVVNALRDLGARVRIEGDSPYDVPLTKEFLAGMVSVQLVTDHGPMDINFRPDGTEGYDDLIRNAAVVELNGISVTVADVADIVRSKQAAGRPKDVLSLPTYLRWLRARGK